MNRLALTGAALALLMGSAAFAQSGPSAAPDPNAPPPALEQEAAPDAADENRRGGDRDRGDRARWQRHGGHHGDGWRQHGGRHMADRHDRAGHHGGRGGMKGAAFRINLGEGAGSFSFKCAAKDSTQECVDAILPILDRVMAGAPAAQSQ